MKRIFLTILILLTGVINICAQIVEAKYDYNYRFGFVDACGKWVVEPTFKYTYWHKDWQLGMFKTGDNELPGLLDKRGKIIFKEGKYKSYYLNKFNHIELTDASGKKGLATIEGKIVFPCRYTDIYETRDYIEVTDASGVGLLKPDGSAWVPCRYKKIYVGEDYIEVCNQNKKGILNLKGKEAVPCIYEEVKKAAEGIYLINMGGVYKDKKLVGGKWGYYANGTEIIPCKYDEATTFDGDVATVKKDGEVKLIKNPLKDGSQIMIAEGGAKPNKKKVDGSAISRYPAPDSDVDKDIPVAKRKAETTFAFIIANENYPDAPVPYSLNDGRVFKEYCQKTLGLPEKNINLYEDATFGNIITAVEKMKQIADAYDGEASVIFYYAGHGFPDDKQQTAYLLPIDGDASSITTTGYSLAKLYKEIAGLKLKSSVIFLDACFSGAKREDQMLASSRGVAIKVKEEAPQGNMVVFSAAQGDETAHQLEDKHHGLFTYCLLKELQATQGNIDLGTLTANVTKQVKRQSVVINNKKQTPTVIPSQALMNSWQTMKLR